MYLKKIINQFCNNNNFCYKITCTVLEIIVWVPLLIGLHNMCKEPPPPPFEFPKDYRGPQMPNIRFWDINELIRKDEEKWKNENKNK
jgi:hypothetical protein